jgi:hypothetical protein
MRTALIAGEFEAITGLTAKALRLYGERGILLPVSVDPLTGYRAYDHTQIRHGLTLDLLRRAQVPLTELATAQAFDFQEWRETVAERRALEDFYLGVAEHIAGFTRESFLAHSNPAPPLDWVGVTIDLGIPSDLEGRTEAFSGLTTNVPAIDEAFSEVLTELNEDPANTVWTAVPKVSRSGSNQMLIARPTALHLTPHIRETIETHVLERTGQLVTVANDTLPRRIEVTFTNDRASEPSPVEEAADGYLQILAFYDHLERHGLFAIHPTTRHVVRGPSLLGASSPVTVFDIHPPTA